jgi:N-acetylmuramoyl-L-alanine amidase
MPKKKLAVLLICMVCACLLASCNVVETAANAYTKGDSGDTVREIQTRLKNWGYYNGAADGVYGEGTVQAVIVFQKKHGVYADGRVGPQTARLLGVSLGSKAKAGTAEKDTGVSGSDREDKGDIYLLAKVIYGEGRGEPYKGMVAIGAVVLNRVKSSQFPNTIPKVVYQKGAFSIVDDGQINLSPDQQALKAARDAINGWDPSGGALFYYNPKKTSNKFITSRPVITVIGDHRFCK